MAEILGYGTLQDKALPVGQDGARIAQWEMRKGLTYEMFAGQVSAALAAANSALAAKWSWLFYITDEIALEYPNGGTVTPMTELTDVDNPAPIKGSTIGHMIDLHYYGEAVGGTWRYFRDVRPAQIEAQITAIVNRGIWRFEQKLLGRFFASTETAIGSSGYNVPFVHSTGGNVDFAPPSYDGKSFATTHDHFIGYNLSTPLAMDTVLEGLAATLAEHGHQPPYTAMVSRADTALYGALTNKVILVDTGAQVIRGGLTSGAQYFAEGTQTLERIGKYQSTLGQIDLIASARIPTGLVGMSKSYGDNNPKNSLYVRVHPQGGFGFSIIPSMSSDRFFPIKQVDVDLEFGVGVGRDRTNGAVGFLVAGGTYADGTIA